MKKPFWPLTFEDSFFDKDRLSKKINKNNKKEYYKLDNFKEILHKIDNPHLKLNNIIHIAGTNGKGSTANFIRTILEESGYTVNLFTSPHLVDYNERFYIKGKHIDDQSLNDVTQKTKLLCSECAEFDISFFEATTLFALFLFNDNKADFNIFEVGLGGRLDATNIFNSEQILASIITSISKDHMAILGNTKVKIAAEKAGIVKKNGTLFIAKQSKLVNKVITKIATENNNDIYKFDKDWTFKKIKKEFYAINSKFYNIKNIKPSLSGSFQYDNACTAIAVTQFLSKSYHNISSDNIQKAISKTIWPCRMEKLTLYLNQKCNITIDGAHNEDGIKELMNVIKKSQKKYKIAIFNFLANKDIDSILKKIYHNFDTFIIIDFKDFLNQNERSLHLSDEIRVKLRTICNKSAYIAKSPCETIDLIKKYETQYDQKCEFYIFGSLYFYQYFKNCKI